MGSKKWILLFELLVALIKYYRYKVFSKIYCRFSNQTTLFSSSLDGTVNAYDIIKYKKFRTLIPDKKCQLMCLAL